MRILVDTSVWYRFSQSLKQASVLESTIRDLDVAKCLCSISAFEIVQKWRSGKLPCADPRTWLDEALEGYEILPVTEPIARMAALWEWKHKDPADRVIAAASAIHGIELWHSDTILKELTGFPQRYFKAPAR